jgi:uncharacterized OsmC-like protein
MQASAESTTFRVTLDRVRDYEFNVRFDGLDVPDLVVDEPEPLGRSAGPNPSRLIAAAAANCLSASLLFCLTKSKVEIEGVTATVDGRLERRERGRLRVGGLDVQLRLHGIPADRDRLRRCLSLFEDYCVVTASLRDGIPVSVAVVDDDGRHLLPPAGTDPTDADESGG